MTPRPSNQCPGRRGDPVHRWDEVYGVGRGSFAEYAVAAQDKLAHKPRELSFEQAAVVPISAAALQALVDRGRIARGQRVLVIGASGGVGSYAVQLARWHVFPAPACA